MKRYQIIKPEMSETLRAIGKTNEEMAHEVALLWLGNLGRLDMGIRNAHDFYDHYDMAYQIFLERLEARDEK